MTPPPYELENNRKDVYEKKKKTHKNHSKTDWIFAWPESKKAYHHCIFNRVKYL